MTVVLDAVEHVVGNDHVIARGDISAIHAQLVRHISELLDAGSRKVDQDRRGVILTDTCSRFSCPARRGPAPFDQQDTADTFLFQMIGRAGTGDSGADHYDVVGFVHLMFMSGKAIGCKLGGSKRVAYGPIMAYTQKRVVVY